MYFWRQIGGHMRQLFCVILFTGLLFSQGCKEEPSYAAEELIGHWEVYAAARNGKETTLLNGAVFLFETDNKMQTNITGEETSGGFTLEQDRILFAGDHPMEFEIAALHGDSLSLKTDIQDLYFVLALKRATTE